MNEQSQEDPNKNLGLQQTDIETFNGLVGALVGHNEQFSLGRLMARAMIDAADQSIKAAELTEAGLPEEEAEDTAAWLGSDKPSLAEEQQMEHELLGITTQDALREYGLGLSGIEKGTSMYGSQGEVSAGKVGVVLSDGSKFSQFLIDASKQEADEKFKESVLQVANSLAGQVFTSLSKEEDSPGAGTGSASDEINEILAYSKSIHSGLESIGAGETETAEKFAHIAEHVGRGDIGEYVRIAQTGIFEEPGADGFGASRWQGDASDVFLATSWQNVIDTIKACDDNPKAAQLKAEAIQAARASLSYAMNDWGERSKSGTYHEGYGQGFDEIFEKVSLELDFIAS